MMGFSEEIDGGKRSCSDCKTAKTPLWRSGPDGPKSLCNACGIRFRKKSPTRKEPEKRKEKPASSSSATTCSSSGGSSASSPSGGGKGSNRGNQMREDLRVRLMAFGKELVLWQRPRSPVKRQRTSHHHHQKLGEEEQAAVLLMDLSCGSVFA